MLPYRDESLPYSDRAADLCPRMESGQSESPDGQRRAKLPLSVIGCGKHDIKAYYAVG